MKDKWHGCYDDSWKDHIVPEAFSHPAKMSYGLLCRIIQHIKQNKWAKKGSVIVDPFGGIGSTGILGTYNDYRVVCVELEQKFVDLAKQNMELHRNAWVQFGNPEPVILQGDSRKLCELVESADLVLSSTPYEGSLTAGGHLVFRPGMGNVSHKDSKGKDEIYGQSENQLGNQQGDTFWASAKTIVQQCHQILRPGGHAIWVTKDFVRKGKRVTFSDDWQKLCESIGFKTVCRHQAMLAVDEVQEGLFGEIREVKEDKSFFRRLTETKAAHRRYWEETFTELEQQIRRFKTALQHDIFVILRKAIPSIAMATAFEESGEHIRDWNEHIRIDHEDVHEDIICMEK